MHSKSGGGGEAEGRDGGGGEGGGCKEGAAFYLTAI